MGDSASLVSPAGLQLGSLTPSISLRFALPRHYKMFFCKILAWLLLMAAVPVVATAQPGQPSASPESSPAGSSGDSRQGLQRLDMDELGGDSLGDGTFRASDRRASEPTPGKVLRYVEALIRKHDTDGDGVLSEHEWRGAAGNPQAADIDHDGIITPEELVERILVYSRHRSLRLVRPAINPPLTGMPSGAEPGVVDDQSPLGGEQGSRQSRPDEVAAGDLEGADAERVREQARRSRKFYIPRDRLPAGTPEWFIDRDADGDGQITMREFSAKWSPEVAAEFSAYDRNGDGVITAAEAAAGARKPADTSATAADGAAVGTPRRP